ncbi:outer membrane protein OmpA-like peptidoglycan-associated protein [Nitrosomonas sp. Nm84]|uniref:OmpA family protein n=1 Tax=Nitrosomonas sp. Nm84 TaxID=200124 RepID=UPI000D752899|nr:OmpA family protein [Nitrosomonas sp. Nm84]PXW91222.1 outer membrane protein OmpA-like peptidoglycan-associated protein [Nitrosomonas sp. Nm84]
MQNNWYFSMILVVPAIIFSGCSSMPQNPSLIEAHSNYNNALTNPQVTDMAALELKEASKFLDKADNALNKRESDATVNHLAYMANQQVAIAQETAKAKAAEAVVANANTARDRVLLEARTAEAEEAKRQLEELKAKKTDRGLVITLQDVLFRTNMAQLEVNGLRTVHKLADFLKQYPERTVLIEGHTDSTGSDSYNQGLSERRAHAVRMALLDSGISSNRIAAKGYGESFPVASNDTAENRQLNRRVEIILSNENGVVSPR